MLALRLSLLLRRLLPNAQWLQRIERNCWDLFWAQEEQKEREVAGDQRPATSIIGSERAEFVEIIGSFAPFRTILELGCGFAQNAHILCKLFPRCRYVGLDVDEQRIAQGAELLKREQLDAAQLVLGDMRELERFPSKSVDIVLCAAALMYIDSAEIEHVAKEMVRIAKRVIVLLEQHDSCEDGFGRLVSEPKRPDYWLRNYERLFSVIDQRLKVTVCTVSKPRWQLEQWQQLATVVAIEIERV